MEGPAGTHWTHRLFVDNAHLYLPFLEQAKKRAGAEVDALIGLFSELGVPQGGRVLDLACGIGRHSVLLAKRGYDVTGVDISPLFIEKSGRYASEEGISARFLVGDGLQIDRLLGEEELFHACINMFTSHSYYGRDGDVRMFSGLSRIASPGAVLVVLTANRDFIVKNLAPRGVETAGEHTIVQHRELDLESSSMNNTWEFYDSPVETSDPRLTLDMRHRIYSLHEIKELLEESGWRYVRGLGAAPGGGLELVPLQIDSIRMWIVAQR